MVGGNVECVLSFVLLRVVSFAKLAVPSIMNSSTLVIGSGTLLSHYDSTVNPARMNSKTVFLNMHA